MAFNINASCFSRFFLSFFLSTTSIVIASSLSGTPVSSASEHSTALLSANSSLSSPCDQELLATITTVLTKNNGTSATITNEQDSSRESWLPWNTRTLIDHEELNKFSRLPPLVKMCYWCNGAFVSSFDKKNFERQFQKRWKQLTSEDLSLWPNN